MVDSNNSHPYRNITRRNILQFTAGAGTIGLAGCFGTDKDGDNGNGNDDDFTGEDPGTPLEDRDLDGDPIDNEFTAAPVWNIPTEMQWNEFNFFEYEFLLGSFIHDPLAIWNPAKEEHIPCLAEEWTIDSDAGVFEVTIRDDYYWYNGDNVTADDVWLHFELEQYMGFSSSDFVESGEVTGDYTVEFPLKGEINETVGAVELLRQDLTHAPSDRYGEFLERFEDADSEEEIEEIKGELGPGGYSPEEPMAFGPFEPVNFTEREVQFELHEDHPAADDINFTEFTWVQTRDLNDQWQALRAGHYDALTNAPAPGHIEAEFPDEITAFGFREHGGMALQVNHDTEPLGDRRIRAALAYYLDNETIAGNVGDTVTIPVERHTGLSDQMAEDWVDDLDSFHDYGFDMDRAAELLEEAGLTQDDEGNWTYDGEPFELEIQADAGQGAAVTAAQTVANQLREVGIQTEVFTTEGGTLYDDIVPSGDYDVVINTWGGDYNIPFHVFNGQLGPDHHGDREDFGYPAEVSLPPVGDPDGSERTYNLDEIVAALREGSPEETKQATTEICWMWNHDLIKIQLFEGVSREYVNTEKWYWPPIEDETMVPPPMVWPTRYGMLQAQTE